MRLELAERLRCPAAHTPTPLIVVAERTVDRELITALLGCPVCRLEARIVDGDVRFGALTVDRSTAAASEAGHHAGLHADPAPALDRVAAQLGLSEPGGALLLTGRYSAFAPSLAELFEVSVVIMHGPAARGAAVAAVHGLIDTVPFTDGTFRAAALDADLSARFSADAVRATATSGRVLAKSSVPAPPGLKELARDDTEWVATRESGGAMVELKRRV